MGKQIKYGLNMVFHWKSIKKSEKNKKNKKCGAVLTDKH